MKSHIPLEGVQSRAPVAQVGRLTPLPGVTMRAHPDRRLVRQFLKELRLPLAASESMLDLVADVALPETVGMALAAVRNQNDFVQRLVMDFEQYGQLEQDTVEPKPAARQLRPWLDALLAKQRRMADELRIDMSVRYRSFLPSSVVFDEQLAERAIASVLHVAMQRSLPGIMELAVVFDEGRGKQGNAELRLEVTTRGGGFSEIEHGYVFSPFQVHDAASRPLLGLSLGQRLAELLGGELCVESAGSSSCSYRLRLRAEPAMQAVWVDPVGDGCHFGPVRPGQVLFVGHCEQVVACCREDLRQAGFTIEQVAREEQVLARLEREPYRWSAVVMDATSTSETRLGFIDAVRESGFGAALLAIIADADERHQDLLGFDAVLHQPDGLSLLAALREARDYKDRKNASNAS